MDGGGGGISLPFIANEWLILQGSLSEKALQSPNQSTEKSIEARQTKEGYFQFSWSVDGNIRNGVLIRVCQCVMEENNGVREAGKIIVHSLIAIKLLYIPPEGLF